MSSTAKKAAEVGFGILVSRILGVIREQVFAFFLGAGRFSDAFLVAFRIPNLLRDLFAEGALTAGFVPVFSKALVSESKDHAFRFASNVINIVFVILTPLVLLGIIFSPLVVKFIAPGFTIEPDKFLLTSKLLKILMPFILFQSFAAILMGSLNSMHSYRVPSLASAVFNAVNILAGFFIYLFGKDQKTAVFIWTWGALLGGLGQFLFQVPSFLTHGFKWSFIISFSDQHVKKFLSLVAPAIIGLAATQINILVNTMLASSLEEGSVSWLNYSFRLIMLPIGIFGVAIGTVSGVQSAHAAASKDIKKLIMDLSSSLRLNLFFSISATSAFIAVGTLVISVLFEHGRFTSFDTKATYDALLFMSVGLFAYSSVKVIVPVFYALENSKIPALSSVMAVVANLIVSLSTWKILKFRGLALGTSVAAIVNFFVLVVVFRKKYGVIFDKKTIIFLLKTIFCSILLAAVSFLIQKTSIYNFLYLKEKLGRIILLFVIVPFGIIFFFLLSFIMGIEESKLFILRLKKR